MATENWRKLGTWFSKQIKEKIYSYKPVYLRTYLGGTLAAEYMLMVLKTIKGKG